MTDNLIMTIVGGFVAIFTLMLVSIRLLSNVFIKKDELQKKMKQLNTDCEECRKNMYLQIHEIKKEKASQKQVDIIEGKLQALQDDVSKVRESQAIVRESQARTETKVDNIKESVTLLTKYLMEKQGI